MVGALHSARQACSCKKQSILSHPTSSPFPAPRSITAIDYIRAGKQMPKYINQSPRCQRDFIKTITPSSVFLPTPGSSAQWPFLLEGFQELCRHDLMAGGISSIWGKFRPREGARTSPMVRRWKPGVWKYVRVSVQYIYIWKCARTYVCLKKNLELSHISETFCNYRWNFYKSIPSGRLMSFTKWFNCEISLYNWVHFNAERGRFA